MEIQFFPLDLEYQIKNEVVWVYLYGLLEQGGKICVRQQHRPFFYAQAEGVDEELLASTLSHLSLPTVAGNAKVVSWEKVERELLGQKSTFFKLYTNFPQAVPIIAKELESAGMKCYERDILFVHRYLRDTKIVPMTLVKASGEFTKDDTLKVPLFSADEITQVSLEAVQQSSILAVDIETYARRREIDPLRNPILMIGLYGVKADGKEFRKVLTWKKFSHNLEYLEQVHDEIELLQRFVHIVKEFNPDIITGYFSDGFDFPYLKARADHYNITLDLGMDNSELMAGKMGSSRDGEARIRGILHLDMLKFIRNIFGKDLKTDSYSLDAVSEELLGHGKHKVNLDELAQTWDEMPDKLSDYCAYNLHDAHLAYRLCQKLLPDMIEFTKIVGLPTFDVIRMRFSRLVENYILKRAIEYNVIAPNKPSDYESGQRREDSIQGAYVYEPTPGLYQDIVVFDFRSLYPTIITAHNIGPEGFRCSCCYEQEHVPDHEDYWFCQQEKKFIPTVLEQLILRRVDLKRLIKEQKQKAQDTKILEARSYALKILANSFYGYLGFFGARWYCLECAAATTAYARNYIKTTIAKAQERGFKVIYGDSVTPERKIFIMNEKSEVQLIPIGEFVDNNINNVRGGQYKTLAFDGQKIVFSPIKNVIRHEYNSSAKGEILTFITTHGTTKVTPQHSIYKYEKGNLKLVDAMDLHKGDFLVSLTGTPITEIYFQNYLFDVASLPFGPLEKEICFYTDNFQFPSKRGICPYCNKEVHLSSHVYTHHQERRVPITKDIPQNFSWVGTNHAEGGKIPRYWTLTKELAWILGFYAAEGSASDTKTKSGVRKRLISFGSQDLEVIKRVKKYFDQVIQDDLKIIVNYDTRIQKQMYYYRVQRIPLVGLFVDGFGCGKKSIGKKVPSFIYSSEEKIRRAFIEGYLEGDGNKSKDKRYSTHFRRCDTNSKELACGLQYLFKSLQHGLTCFGKEIKHVGWRYRKDKPLVSSLRIQNAKKKKSEGNIAGAQIKEIKKEYYNGPVYDIEVENQHNFVDAEGLILVHNTDSMFMILEEKILDQAMEFMNEINFDLPGHMELDFQGHYPQGLFVAQKGSEKGAKKKYALIDEHGKVKITGFETVRRNWSAIAKEVQEKVLLLILTGRVEEALGYVREVVAQLQKGLVPVEKLIIKTQITRELGGYTSIGPHVAIARKMAERGDVIVPGTVVEYVIAKGVGLVRERAMFPENVTAGNYDATYYIHNQLLPAVSSIFAVLGHPAEELFSDSSQTGLGKFM